MAEKELTVRALFERDIRFANWERDVEIVSLGFGSADALTEKIRIYTNANCYSITSKRYGNGRTYLGCIASSRKSRAGEDWQRGNDLPDGPLSERTWEAILGAIVGYELQKIHRPESREADQLATIEDGGPAPTREN